jgi:hypothetical protein
MNNIKDIAEQTITDVLQKAVFIFTDPISENEIPALDTWEPDGVSIRFTGKPSGTVYIWVSKGFACCVAANMLGIDKDEPKASEQGIDALKELLNMIVGNLLTAVFGEEPVFELSLPVKAKRNKLLMQINLPDKVWLQAEGNPFLFTMEIDS